MRKDVKELYSELVEAERRYDDLQILLSEKAIHDFTITTWRLNDENNPEIGVESWMTKEEQNRISAFIQKEITIQKQNCKDLEKRLSDCYK